MSTLFGLRDIAPLGAGIEMFDENDPAVTPRWRWGSEPGVG